MMPSVRAIDRFSTQDELFQALHNWNVPSRVLGTEAESPREFFCFHLFSPAFGEVNVAILSIGMGTEPSCIVKSDCVFIGFNDRVAVIWADSGIEVRQVDLLTLSATLIDVPSLSHAIVVGESAVIAISTAAQIIWRRDTDLITNFRVNGTQLFLSFSDEPPAMIQLKNGSVRSEGEGPGGATA